MFGYVIVNKPELKFREYDTYRAYYCGLCRSLKKRHGFAGQLTLSYDMTFLVMLLTSLYEPDISQDTCRCAAHPFRKQNTTVSMYSDYVADMNVILSYYKCVDDWQDEKKLSGFAFSKLIQNTVHCPSTNNRVDSSGTGSGAFTKHTFTDYDEKVSKISELLSLLKEKEDAGVTDIDTMAGIFGNIMSVLFTPHHDEWEASLSRIGFFLGKFIYILDAYDDLEKDIKNNSYNPFKDIYTEPDFRDNIFSMLKMMMAECSSTFEFLPIVDNIEILRNILYAGVWQSRALYKEERKSNE